MEIFQPTCHDAKFLSLTWWGNEGVSVLANVINMKKKKDCTDSCASFLSLNITYKNNNCVY